MKLHVTDQIAISSVAPHTLAAGAEIDVSDALGAELLKKHPDKVKVADGEHQVEQPAAGHKAEKAPKNKAEKAPKNKDDGAAAGGNAGGDQGAGQQSAGE